ncbi:MAG: STAS domain-containing protein [Leptospiraceae bacterium]|nr:STAS domain-containing protein [Leptospiraceae bacterium]
MQVFTYDSLELEYSVENINGERVAIISLKGKISHENVNQILEDMEDLVSEDEKNFLLNLKQLNFMNSLGLALILSWVRKSEENKGKFVIGGYNPVLDLIIQLVEVSDKIKVFHSFEEAKLSW